MIKNVENVIKASERFSRLYTVIEVYQVAMRFETNIRRPLNSFII